MKRMKRIVLILLGGVIAITMAIAAQQQKFRNAKERVKAEILHITTYLAGVYAKFEASIRSFL